MFFVLTARHAVGSVRKAKVKVVCGPGDLNFALVILYNYKWYLHCYKMHSDEVNLPSGVVVRNLNCLLV